jgi:hypothetical protein
MTRILTVWLLLCSVAVAQPVKKQPPPFDKSMSAYTQTNIQDSMFNKHVLSVGNGGSGQSCVVLAADSATTGQALVGSPLKATVAANGRYLISGTIIASSDGVAGLKLGIRIPSGDTCSVVFNGSDSTVSQNKWSIVTADSGLTLSYVNANATGYIRFEGYVSGPTAGSVILGFLKITSGTATLKKNSIFAWKRIW